MKIEQNKVIYYISHMDEATKKKHTELFNTIRDNGICIISQWQGDYLVSTYLYNNTKYELWENMEYGIKSEVIEFKEAM